MAIQLFDGFDNAPDKRFTIVEADMMTGGAGQGRLKSPTC